MSSHLEHGGSVIGPIVVLVLIICWLSDNHDSTTGEPATPAAVQGWTSQADTVLAANGVTMTSTDNDDVDLIIKYESGGNPSAINLTDSNARAGHPSKGLMQTIDGTFAKYCAPGYCANIYDPVSNIVAGTRYAITDYGSLANVPGVVAIRNGGKYVGY